MWAFPTPSEPWPCCASRPDAPSDTTTAVDTNRLIGCGHPINEFRSIVAMPRLFSSSLSAMSSRSHHGAHRFFVPPHFEREQSARGLDLVDHRAHALPTTFLVKPRRSVISNSARQPGRRHTGMRELNLGIRDQCRGRAGTTRRWQNEELIQLVSLDDGEAGRGADWTNHPDSRKMLLKPGSEVLDCPSAREFGGHDPSVRLVPAVEPNPGQLIELSLYCISYCHAVCRHDARARRQAAEPREANLRAPLAV
jgi:hypothetical protein